MIEGERFTFAEDTADVQVMDVLDEFFLLLVSFVGCKANHLS